MVLIPRVGFGGKETADNVLGRGKKKPHMAKPRAGRPVHVSVSRIVKNLAWGLREVPQTPWIFHGALILQRGTKPAGLCTNQMVQARERINLLAGKLAFCDRGTKLWFKMRI